MITKVLVVVGGVNWGLVGLGMLLGNSSWNVVKMIVGSIPMLEGVVYVLVGVAAVMMIFGCKCGTCKDGVCESCVDGEKTEGSM
jgi:hypothetical protein